MQAHANSYWMTEPDQQLLEHALGGDEAAFTVLYRRRQGAIFRFGLHMSGSVPLAEDVTQETFLILLTEGRRYDASRGPLTAFLYGIARNLVLRRLTRDDGEELTGDAAAQDDVLGDLTRRETIEQVRRAVLSLPALYREPVVLCDLGEASYDEAALAMNCPVGTVRSRLNRARAMLGQKLRAAQMVRS